MFELWCMCVCVCVTGVCFEFIGYTTARLWKTVAAVWTISQCRRAHMEKLLSVWKISATYRPGRDSEKSIFSFSARAFPEDNEFDCFHTHTHRKRVLVLACSAVFHMVFPIDGTLMAVTQLWSMCSYQYFSLSARPPLCLYFHSCSSLNQWQTN